MGQVPPFGTLVLGYLIGQLGNLVPLPGGIGATEGALIGVFALYGVNVAGPRRRCSPTDSSSWSYRRCLSAPAFVMLRRKRMRADRPAAMCAPLALDVVKLPARS